MAIDKSYSVEVKGIPQLRNALKKIEHELPGDLRDGFKVIADMIADDAKSYMPSRTGRMKGSVGTRGTFGGAAISAYGTKAPYGQFQDFGGSTGRGHRKGLPWSGAIKRPWRGVPTGSGRYIYFAIKNNRKKIRVETDKVLEKLAKAAGFQTTGGENRWHVN